MKTVSVLFYLPRHPQAGTMLLLFALLFALVLPAQAQEDSLPNQRVLDCNLGDPPNDENPDNVDIVGDNANSYWSAVTGEDNDFLYFGLRLNGDPTGTKGFDQKAWVALINIPNSDPFQYQVLVSLNGNSTPGFSNDTIEIWSNNPAEDVAFDPIFNDPADDNEIIFEFRDTNSAGFQFETPSSSGPSLAYSAPTTAGFGGQFAYATVADSDIDGNDDYLIFWAVPKALLFDLIGIDQSDLDDASFFLATSADANNYNKDVLDCPFTPNSSLGIEKQFDPEEINPTIDPAETTTRITVTNTDPSVAAVGVVILDNDFASCMVFDTNDVTVTLPSGSAQTSLIADSAGDPQLEVRVDVLAPGDDILVEVVVDYGNCAVEDLEFPYTNIAYARAINADEVEDPAGFAQVLPVELVAFEAVLDGRDALLYWETASETNNAGFEIQHRKETADNNGVFEALSWLNGAGTTEAVQRYDFRVEALTPGRHVFRLKQVDFDGTFAYSPEIEVAVDVPESFLVTAAYPNPFNPQASFSVSVKQTQEVVVTLYNMVGQQVLNLYQGMLPGGTTRALTIDGSTLQSGMYLLRVQGERFTSTQTITLLK